MPVLFSFTPLGHAEQYLPKKEEAEPTPAFAEAQELEEAAASS